MGPAGCKSGYGFSQFTSTNKYNVTTYRNRYLCTKCPTTGGYTGK